MSMTHTDLILGPHGHQMFFAMMFFLLLGALLRKLFRLSRRKPSSQTSPRKFNPVYWIQDNWVDLALGSVMAFVFVRWPSFYIEPFIKAVLPSMDTKETLLMGSLLVGVGIDAASEHLAKILNLKK